MNSTSTTASQVIIKSPANPNKITLEEAEVEVAKEILRAHNCLHGTKLTWEHLPSHTKHDIEFKARSVLEWIGNNAHRISQ